MYIYYVMVYIIYKGVCIIIYTDYDLWLSLVYVLLLPLHFFVYISTECGSFFVKTSELTEHDKVQKRILLADFRRSETFRRSERLGETGDVQRTDNESARSSSLSMLNYDGRIKGKEHLRKS